MHFRLYFWSLTGKQIQLYSSFKEICWPKISTIGGSLKIVSHWNNIDYLMIMLDGSGLLPPFPDGQSHKKYFVW